MDVKKKVLLISFFVMAALGLFILIWDLVECNFASMPEVPEWLVIIFYLLAVVMVIEIVTIIPVMILGM